MSKTFTNTAAQGEIFIERIKALPANAKKLTPTDGFYVIGHSETGHHHVIAAGDGVAVYEHHANGMKMLYAVLDNPGVQLIHMRDFDTHEPIEYGAGIFAHGTLIERDPYADEIRRQAD